MLSDLGPGPTAPGFKPEQLASYKHQVRLLEFPSLATPWSRVTTHKIRISG
jgi:hypothetical protein